MMSAPVKNIQLNRGEDYSVTGYIRDKFGNSADISLSTFRAEVRDYCGGALLASFTFAVYEDTSVTPSRWTYERTMAQAVINAIPAGVVSGVWDQFREDVGGESTKLVTGTVEITCNTTNPTV